MRRLSVFASFGTVCLVLLVLVAGCSHKPKPSAIESAEGAFDELRAAVRSEIKDPEKAAQGTHLVDQLESLVKEANNDRKAHDDRIRSLNVNYDSTEEEFQAAFRELNARQKERQKRVLALNENATYLTTVSEWDALAKVREDMLKKALDATLEVQWQP